MKPVFPDIVAVPRPEPEVISGGRFPYIPVIVGVAVVIAAVIAVLIYKNRRK